MPAAGQDAREEADALVAQFHVGPQAVADVTAAQVDRLEARGLEVFEDQILVVVLAFDFEFDFDQVAAPKLREVDEFAALVLLDLLRRKSDYSA
ncbi:MAG TPA: hypothetical protein PK129_01120 [Cellvibrionaceae bacterium]|nr:hypothetical protein [Cellvibrionaceae bacterium]